MTQSLYEIIKKSSDSPDDAQKIHVLQTNVSDALKTVLGYAFDSRVVWDLPPGSPPYTPLKDHQDAQGRLFYESRKLNNLLKGGNLSATVKETKFIQVLESVDPDDAKLLLAIKEKRLPKDLEGVTKEIVGKAFPGLKGGGLIEGKGW